MLYHYVSNFNEIIKKCLIFHVYLLIKNKQVIFKILPQFYTISRYNLFSH